jgi:hypothetical protein
LPRWVNNNSRTTSETTKVGAASRAMHDDSSEPERGKPEVERMTDMRSEPLHNLQKIFCRSTRRKRDAPDEPLLNDNLIGWLRMPKGLCIDASARYVARVGTRLG